MNAFAVQSKERGLSGFRPFSPSGARPPAGGLKVYQAAGAMLNTTIWLGSAVAPSPSAVATLPLHLLFGRSAPLERSPVLRSRDMAKTITGQLEFPVSALASVLGVERKTVYDWIKGSDAQPTNAERLRTLYDAFGGEADGSFRFYHRFWMRQLPNGGSLCAVLMDPSSGTGQIKAALDELRPAVSDALASHMDRKKLPFERLGAADHLAEYLEAGVRG